MREKDLEFIRNGVKFRTVTLIDCQRVTISVKAIVGYCHSKLHTGYLTTHLMNTHDCIGKNCNCFEKFEQYPYWVKVANRRKNRKQQKAATRRKKERMEARDPKYEKQMHEVLVEAQKIIKNYEFPITITRIAPSNSGNFEEFVINYVSSSPIDDSESYTALSKELGYTYYGTFFIRRLRMPDGTFATIEDWEKRIALTGKPSCSFY